MSLLTGLEIARRVDSGEIVIAPYDPANVNPNSYDGRLDDTLRVYDTTRELDVGADNPTTTLSIPPDGLVLHPGVLYLGSTVEVFGCDTLAAVVEGKSSLGRLGLTAHVTAGFIDCGFRGNITLEISVIHPLRVYAGMRVCQVCFTTVVGEVTLYAGKYQGQRGPQPSRSWRDFTARDRPNPPDRPDHGTGTRG